MVNQVVFFFRKIPLTSNGTGIELHENGIQWIPTSTCVLHFYFYGKYTELSHETGPNLFQLIFKS